jgi:hypothetical protein
MANVYVDGTGGGSGGGATPAGATGEVQINNGTALGAATNVNGGSGYLSIGTTPAATGALRLANNTFIKARYSLDNGDGNVIGLNTTNGVVIGDSGNGTLDIVGWSSGYCAITFGSTEALRITGSQALSSVPLAFGVNASASGNIRLPSAGVVNARNTANTGDLTAFATSAADSLYIGSSTSLAANQFSNVFMIPATAVYLGGAGNAAAHFNAAGLTLDNNLPLILPGSSSLTITGTGSVQLGTAPSTAGSIRFSKASNITKRNVGGTLDLTVIDGSSASDALFIGTDAAFTAAKQVPSISMYSSSGGAVYIGNGGTTRLSATSAGVSIYSIGDPLIFGYTGAATTGLLRMPNAGSMLAFRNSGDTGDFVAMASNVGNLYIGEDNTGANQVANVTLAASGGVQAVIGSTVLLNVGSSAVTLGHQTNTSATTVQANNTYLWGTTQTAIYNTSGSGYALRILSSSIESGQPINGGTTVYGVHGVGTQAMADANQTVAAAIYKYSTIKTTGAITANRNLVLPAAADIAAYIKIVNNTCTGGFSVIVGDGGAGTTVTVANGTTITVLFDSRGATQVGVAVSGSGSFTAPTGSGLMTTTSGVMNTAASAVGAGVLTFLSTPTSANLASAITDETGTGSLMFGTSPTIKTSLIINNPANTFAYTLTPAAITAAITLNLPLLTATDTIVCAAFTQTLTNKTLTAPVISSITNTGTLTLPTATCTLVGDTTTDTLTNKTLTTPVIATITNTGTLTLPTATCTIVGDTTTNTLTNKTLTSPVLGGTPTISAATIVTSVDTKGTNTDRQPVHVQTTDATVTTLDSFTIASGSTVALSWMVTCIKSDSSAAGAFQCTAVFRNNAGTVAQVGSSSTMVLGSDFASTCTATIDNSTTTIRLRVTGVAATTIQWTAVATQLTVIP